MPWWSWLVIWGSLGLLALAALAFLGYRIVIKFMAVFSALGDLADKTALLDAQTDALVNDRVPSAVFADPVELARARRAQKARRAHRRQLRREARVLRGKIIVKADPHQFSHLLKRT
jgi:hypothetical protein